MDAFEVLQRQGGDQALRVASRFFMGTDPVHDALHRITSRLEQLGIPYAVSGGMALFAHGYRRLTEDVDILVNREGLKTLHEALEGRGYLPPFQGSKNLRDTETKVKIEFLVTGDYPGDGKPKPLAFPEPAQACCEINGVRYLALPRLVELKLASGMTNAARLKDLADVQELIKSLSLGEAFAEDLHPFVQEKYRELWRAVEEASGSDL